MVKRILLTTSGSLGDLHPFMAIGLALVARGHAVTVATAKAYQAKVEQSGLAFAPMGPHLSLDDSEMMQRLIHLRKGPEYLVRQLLCPSVPAAYEEVLDAAQRADIIVTHPIAFAAQIVAEKTGLPWVSTVTAPMSFFSHFDPPVLTPYPSLVRLRAIAPAAYVLLLRLGQASTKPWMAPVDRFRRSLGLSTERNLLYEGQHSPQRVLALFSRVMAEPQPDWPPKTLVTGFPFYDQAGSEQEADPDLERFLDSGPPPVVFTLGSSAVRQAGMFYEESLEAIRQLGCRAVLLAGGNRLAGPLPPGTAVFPYCPYSRIFPRAAAIVHSGGIGTCGQALAAGRPMLVVPYAFDQPDNADRLVRLGVARTIHRNRYSARRASQEIAHLLSNPAYAVRAVEVARRIAAENGAQTACEAIENHA